MIPLLLCAAALSGPEVEVDLGGDVKSFFLGSFPYDHLLMEQAMPGGSMGQGIVDGRLKLELEAADLVELQVHHALTTTTPGQTMSVLASSGVGQQSPEAVDLSWDAVEDDGLAVRGRVDRLVAKLSIPHFDLAVGRQAITFGKTVFFTPMDLVNPFHPAVIDQEYKPGVDAVRADVYLGMATQFTVAAAYAGSWDAEGLVVAGYGQGTIGVWDLGVFLGMVHADAVGGLATVGSIGVIGLRGEVTVTLPDADEEDPFVRAAVGADWMPTTKTTVSGELYLQTLGAASPDDYLLTATSDRYQRGELWAMGRYYLGLSCSQELHPLVHGSIAVIANLADPSALVLPSVSWSVADNAAVAAGAFFGVGERPGDITMEELLAEGALTEEAMLAAIPVNSEFGLVPHTAYVQVKTYF